jgi:hypothetical protein
MKKFSPACCIKWIGCCLAFLFVPPLMAEPIFDTHLHYNAGHAKQFNPQQVIAILDRNSIAQALVTSIPAQHAMQLHRQAPGRILPLLGVYRNPGDKETWASDTGLPSRIEAQFKQGNWCGIGELHLFASDRHSPVFTRIIKFAQQHRLPLLLHADPAVIDTVYAQAPGQPVIWAHAGTFPYPDLIADYLERYPALRVDLSVRDQRIAPEGVLRDDWYELFVRYPDRFMVGVDTYSLSRWHAFDLAVANIREWLQQLPADVARRLAYGNAAVLFEASGTRQPCKIKHTTTTRQ